MKRPPLRRSIRVLDIAAILLLFPNILVFSFYVFSEKMMEEWPYIPSDVESCFELLKNINEDTYRCDPHPRRTADGEHLFPLKAVNDCANELPLAVTGFVRAGFLGLRHKPMLMVKRLKLPLTRSFFVAHESAKKMQTHVRGWYYGHAELCLRAHEITRPRREREAGAQVVALRRDIEELWPPVKAAMDAHQKNRPFIAVIAWTLLLFEAFCFIYLGAILLRRLRTPGSS